MKKCGGIDWTTNSSPIYYCLRLRGQDKSTGWYIRGRQLALGESTADSGPYTSFTEAYDVAYPTLDIDQDPQYTEWAEAVFKQELI